MKKRLMEYIFKKELAEIHKNYERHLKKEIYFIEKDTQEKIEKSIIENGIAHRIFFLFKNAEIIGIEENKDGEEVYVFKYQTNSSLDIYLCGKSYQAINGLPRIMTDIREDEKIIKIEDIQTVDIDIGNGSILMEYLIKTAKKMKINTIRGWLSPVDSDHFDRSEHYYKKLGFDVVFDDCRTSGSIELKV